MEAIRAILTSSPRLKPGDSRAVLVILLAIAAPWGAAFWPGTGFALIAHGKTKESAPSMPAENPKETWLQVCSPTPG